MGNLYIVATPIGNLQDITLRALDTLSGVDYIASEDTRKTSILIRHYFKAREKEMLGKLFSYYEETEAKRIPQIINLLLNGKNVALVSDAGTPTISDPGFKLVRECIKNNLKVISIPGATSVISALVSSGLPTDKFIFLGFLPQKPGHRIKLLQNLQESQKYLSSTVIIFESLHKLISTLEDIKSVFGNINIVLSKELSKIHEARYSGQIDAFIKAYKKEKLKGEYIILFNLK